MLPVLSVPHEQARSRFTAEQGQIWVRFMFCTQIKSRFAPCLTGRSSESVGLVSERYRRRVGLTTGGVAEGGRSQAYDTASCRNSQILRVLEVLKQVCLTRVDLASCQGSNWLSWPVEPSRELMGLGSIDASQAGRKVVGRGARDLAAASFGGSSRLWRRQ